MSRRRIHWPENSGRELSNTRTYIRNTTESMKRIGTRKKVLPHNNNANETFTISLTGRRRHPYKHYPAEKEAHNRGRALKAELNQSTGCGPRGCAVMGGGNKEELNGIIWQKLQAITGQIQSAIHIVNTDRSYIKSDTSGTDHTVKEPQLAVLTGIMNILTRAMSIIDSNIDQSVSATARLAKVAVLTTKIENERNNINRAIEFFEGIYNQAVEAGNKVIAERILMKTEVADAALKLATMLASLAGLYVNVLNDPKSISAEDESFIEKENKKLRAAWSKYLDLQTDLKRATDRADEIAYRKMRPYTYQTAQRRSNKRIEKELRRQQAEDAKPPTAANYAEYASESMARRAGVEAAAMARAKAGVRAGENNRFGGLYPGEYRRYGGGTRRRRSRR